MTEHLSSTAVTVEVLDPLSMKHHLYRNPQGAFYLVTNRQKVLKARFWGESRTMLYLESFGERPIRGFTTKSVSVSWSVFAGFGVVKLIVFVERQATDLEDLTTIAGAQYGELMKEPEGPKYAVLDELTSETVDVVGTEYYILVQKASLAYPSVFYTRRATGTTLDIYLIRQDVAVMTRSTLYHPSDKFSYKLGGRFVIQTAGREGKKGKPRDIGRVLSIIRVVDPIPWSKAYGVLQEVRHAPK